MDILQRERNGEEIHTDDREFYKIRKIIERAFKLTAKLNKKHRTYKSARKLFAKITRSKVDETFRLRAPFYTDFGENITVGKNVMINQCCTFMSRGGITIGNDVFIAQKVNLVTLNHVLNPYDRSTTVCKPIVIGDRVWIGIAATILPDVTIGENSIVGANAVVTHDVPPNTVVAGNPAKVIKTLDFKSEK